MQPTNKKVLFRSEHNKVYYFWSGDSRNNKVMCVDSSVPVIIIGHYYPIPEGINFNQICEQKKNCFFVGMNKYTVLWSKKW